MKVFLMHPDQDFDLDLDGELPPNQAALTQDLELDTLLGAMAQGDQFLHDVAKRALLASLRDPQAIVYRQQILTDCLAQPAVVRELYQLAVEAIANEKRGYFWLSSHSSPDMILHRSVEVMEMFAGMLRRLRRLAEDHAGQFRSDGFARLFAMLAREFDDDYLQTVDGHLRRLKFRRGVVVSAELGTGNKGVRYVLRRPAEQGWRQRIAALGRSGAGAGYSFQIADRDESGARALANLRGRGINLVANALAQSSDHLLSFFTMLRAELAFYVGCLNLHARLAGKGEPTCLPVPAGPDEPALGARGLYDPCLSLTIEPRVVGNALDADGKRLVMLTGANQGGKSTFLRAVGLAQLMLQSGMFVAAESFTANPCDGLYTHYKREEDPRLQRGKLDEELRRMSRIADTITPNCLLLCNESFASTNEREGSEIARQVVRELVEAGVKVVYVTHLYDLAHGLYVSGADTAVFLRAERQPDGGRTFRLVQGQPLPTSFGADSYRRIFGTAVDAAPAGRVVKA